jgi:hypothetical protein
MTLKSLTLILLTACACASYAESKTKTIDTTTAATVDLDALESKLYGFQLDYTPQKSDKRIVCYLYEAQMGRIGAEQIDEKLCEKQVSTYQSYAKKKKGVPEDLFIPLEQIFGGNAIFGDYVSAINSHPDLRKIIAQTNPRLNRHLTALLATDQWIGNQRLARQTPAQVGQSIGAGAGAAN